MDGNTAVAHVAYRTNEVCAIYPITPSSTMAELADEWASQGIKNIWGQIPAIQQMQSEGGAAGAVHGALQSGALTTTFTASQGLLLMIPNMFKIAGELTPTVFHVAARALATQALSIFGDHSDVMAVRSTGFAFLCSASVQEAHDMALISQAVTLESRVPVLHFFDGFRTSHELNTLELLSDEQIRAMIDDDLVRAHRGRALSPEHPFIRGTAHNPDTFFQARETVNPFYEALPEIVQAQMDKFGELTGRHYHLFDFFGPADAERVVLAMGTGAETARITAEALQAKGEKVGVLQVRLFRPFDSAALLAALPDTVRTIAVLEQTKEPGAPAEPMYLDVVATLTEAFATGRLAAMPRRWRPVRAVVEGFLSCAGEIGVRRTGETPPAHRLHAGDRRRRVAHQPAGRSGISGRSAGVGQRGVLWPRRRRNGGRQQEYRQNHCRGCRAACAGLLRL
jgi:pyruvate-ferredoxin/flavodoxin oxidoreductase